MSTACFHPHVCRKHAISGRDLTAPGCRRSGKKQIYHCRAIVESPIHRRHPALQNTRAVQTPFFTRHHAKHGRQSEGTLRERASLFTCSTNGESAPTGPRRTPAMPTNPRDVEHPLQTAVQLSSRICDNARHVRHQSRLYCSATWP